MRLLLVLVMVKVFLMALEQCKNKKYKKKQLTMDSTKLQNVADVVAFCERKKKNNI
jgi:hypothetical protein